MKDGRILVTSEDGEKTIFKYLTSAAKELGMNYSTLSKKAFPFTALGYKFEYVPSVETYKKGATK